MSLTTGTGQKARRQLQRGCRPDTVTTENFKLRLARTSKPIPMVRSQVGMEDFQRGLGLEAQALNIAVSSKPCSAVCNQHRTH